MRQLEKIEISQLERQMCVCEDWSKVLVDEAFSPDFVYDVRFSGRIVLGKFERDFELPGGLVVHSGISHATIHNCEIGDNCHFYNIHNYIAGYKIGHDTCIENVNAILVDGESQFGNGVRISVMNENGGREVPIYDHLSSNLAYILTLYRHRPDLINYIEHQIDTYCSGIKSSVGHIGNNVRILNCGSLKNVRIGDNAVIAGTSRLRNGSILSNALAPVKLGSGVKCSDFIICSGVEILDSTIVSRCFVGQGCVFDKHYSAVDSLFFSNCQGMHGEAASIFAGPYTVTHHKSTLLIAGMFSFLNAGSGSNQSNHMYKLGPIHQGLAERGVKTTSDSYLLWPAHIGAFSLVMGRHTNHADTSKFPFSYLIEKGADSFIVPGANLKTVGTIRDAKKWPQRDNRKDKKKLDAINFNLLSPYTIEKMWEGRLELEKIKDLGGENTEVYGYNNCKITNSALKHGIKYYTLGINKFLGNSIISKIEKSIATVCQGDSTTYQIGDIGELRRMLEKETKDGSGDWIDVGGMFAPKTVVMSLLDTIIAEKLDLDEINSRLNHIQHRYYAMEWTWALEKLEQIWGCTVNEVRIEQVRQIIDDWITAVTTLDDLIYADAGKEFDLNSKTGFGIDGDKLQQSKDFEEVRGTFESNPFVLETIDHKRRKTDLYYTVMRQLEKI